MAELILWLDSADYLDKVWAAVKNGDVWKTELRIDQNKDIFSCFLSRFKVDEERRLYLVVHWRGAENDGEIYTIIDPADPGESAPHKSDKHLIGVYYYVWRPWPPPLSAASQAGAPVWGAKAREYKNLE